MFFSKNAAAAALATVVAFSSPAQAIYNPNGKMNTAVYWGQGPGQLDLITYCNAASIDIIPIGFVDKFPQQGNGYPGTNFGNKCWGGAFVYQGPGPDPSKNSLQTQCPTINRDIPLCQAMGKKIILSLGGGTDKYQLTGAQAGRDFADFLWGAFGPKTAAWVNAGKPRPFDGPNGEEVQVDGFDMDIELAPTDDSVGYIAMLQRLKQLFPTGNKSYLLTGAPQCVVPDSNMDAMIQAVPFDLLFVQFYNTPFCSARDWVSKKGINSGFSYDAWTNRLSQGASRNAKLFIGLPASPLAAVSATNFITVGESLALVEAHMCKPNFGGIMLWEATRSTEQRDLGRPYHDNMRSVLVDIDNRVNGCQPRETPTPTSSIRPSSTAAPSPTFTYLPTVDFTCGVRFGTYCENQCCSQSGWCGTTPQHCGFTCQKGYGNCDSTGPLFPSPSPSPSPSPTPGFPISENGMCGFSTGTRCPGNGCCSNYGWCGSTAQHCYGSGCNPLYGTCLG